MCAGLRKLARIVMKHLLAAKCFRSWMGLFDGAMSVRYKIWATHWRKAGENCPVAQPKLAAESPML